MTYVFDQIGTFGFYGFPDRSRRNETWELLKFLAIDNSLPWCTMRDFNDMLSTTNKWGGQDQPQWLIRGFRQAIQENNLIDLPMEAYPFTWIQKRHSLDVVEERLDLAMVTQDWLDIFPHCSSKRGMKVSHFKNAWLEEPELVDVVQQGWNRDSTTTLLHRLSHCTRDLDSWGRKLRMRFCSEIDSRRRRMDEYSGLRGEIASKEYTDLHT
uniref:Endonuclease/exonuclease/phosphatase domain-containing protein n=1 Tax=Cajanus cajan TaxID=3821 RepID=A0A151SS22_CAJCA|nr:hypothetical protein KK1_003814 [Cajanus cajan]